MHQENKQAKLSIFLNLFKKKVHYFLCNFSYSSWNIKKIQAEIVLILSLRQCYLQRDGKRMARSQIYFQQTTQNTKARWRWERPKGRELVIHFGGASSQTKQVVIFACPQIALWALVRLLVFLSRNLTLRLWFYKCFKKIWLPPKRVEQLSAHPILPWVHILLFCFVLTLLLVWSSHEPDERTNLAVNNIKYKKQGYFSGRSVLCFGTGSCQIS